MWDITNRNECVEIVSRPGKFEGEQPYVPYFWDVYLDGFADDDDGERLVFNVCDTDREMFPELGDREQVILVETDNGFVCEVKEV